MSDVAPGKRTTVPTCYVRTEIFFLTSQKHKDKLFRFPLGYKFAILTLTSPGWYSMASALCSPLFAGLVGDVPLVAPIYVSSNRDAATLPLHVVLSRSAVYRTRFHPP
jgi:hypothetical protein